MGNVWGKSDSKGKKSSKVANTTHEGNRDNSLIHSDRDNGDAVERLGKLLKSKLRRVSILCFLSSHSWQLSH